jgi:Ankyrin repeats (many copies)
MTPEDDTLLQADNKLLRAAATGGYMGATNALGRVASVKAIDQDLWTPLHHAARRGDLPMMHLLIARGAEPDPRNRDGDTPEDLAKKHHSEMLAALMLARHGVDRGSVEQGDHTGEKAAAHSEDSAGNRQPPSDHPLSRHLPDPSFTGAMKADVLDPRFALGSAKHLAQSGRQPGHPTIVPKPNATHVDDAKDRKTSSDLPDH